MKQDEVNNVNSAFILISLLISWCCQSGSIGQWSRWSGGSRWSRWSGWLGWSGGSALNHQIIEKNLDDKHVHRHRDIQTVKSSTILGLSMIRNCKIYSIETPLLVSSRMTPQSPLKWPWEITMRNYVEPNQKGPCWPWALIKHPSEGEQIWKIRQMIKKGPTFYRPL